MIELNLLPDIKLEYIRAQRSRRLILSLAVLISAAAIGLLVLLLIVDGLQKKHLSDLNRDISSETSKLQHAPHINQILTVQNQLESLTALHSSKPDVTRLFKYLNQITPSKASINQFSIDFTQSTVTITGQADSLSTVNQFVDTLKFTNYTSANNSTPTKAFSNIVLSSFGISGTAGTTQQASFTITLGFDKTIFDNTQKVDLTVPNTVTTRSLDTQPNDLFSAPATTTSGGSQ